MGTVPISVIYGFEYSLNGFDQKSITKTKTLLDSEERKGFIQRQSAINKTRGCLKEIKGLRQNHIDKGSRPKKKIAYFETLSQTRGEGFQQNLIWKKKLIET